MKKAVITISLVTVICIILFVAVFGIYFHISNLPPKETNGTIIGEVVSVHNKYTVYIKPVGDNNTKQLLEFEMTDNTTFGSAATLASSEKISELVGGTVVEINYTTQELKGGSTRTTVNFIKVSDYKVSSEWPTLILNQDYSWDVAKKWGGMKGEVAYIVKLTAPIEGYIIYVKHKSDARWGQYFLEKSNKFLTEELEVLLEQCATDYDIEIDGLSTSPFENSSILGVFSIDSYKLKTE